VGRTGSRSALAERRRASGRVGGYGGTDAAAREIPCPPGRGARRSGYGAYQIALNGYVAAAREGLPEEEAEESEEW
jgi:hypothetical protein